MYVRTIKRNNKDGSSVEYVQLAHNVWNKEKGFAQAQVLYSFGRREELDIDAIKRLVNSLCRFLEPEDEINAKAKGDMRKGKPTSYGAFQMKKQALKSTGLGWKQKRLLNIYRAFWAGAAFLARLRSKYPGHELPVYGRGMAGLKMDNTRGGRWKLKRAKKLRREHKCKYGTRKRR